MRSNSQFDFDVPRGYCWLLERGLVGYEPFSALQPWYYLDARHSFVVNERWPDPILDCERLVAFARRQDTDDVACFAMNGGKVAAIYLIHGWTREGYTIAEKYSDFWNWLKSVVDDIAGCADRQD